MCSYDDLSFLIIKNLLKFDYFCGIPSFDCILNRLIIRIILVDIDKDAGSWNLIFSYLFDKFDSSIFLFRLESTFILVFFLVDFLVVFFFVLTLVAASAVELEVITGALLAKPPSNMVKMIIFFKNLCFFIYISTFFKLN